MRDIATTRSGHMREMLNLVEDLQEAFAEFATWAKYRDELKNGPLYWNLPCIPDGQYPPDVSGYKVPSKLADKIRAGLDRLRAEM